MVTGSSDLSAMNFGHDQLPPHDQRYEMADEYVEIVRSCSTRGSPARLSPTANRAC